MVNRERLVNEFLELVRIDSLSYKEREMAGTLKAKLEGMGLSVEEDGTGAVIGGNAGNIVCRIPGNTRVPAILLMAHMDTVEPGIGKSPVVEGNIIKTDGTTVLGGDDAAGIECILEAVRVLRENNLEYGDIYVVFTVAEECGLLGAKNLELKNINAQYAFVMDNGGEIGEVAVNAPSQNKIDVKVLGRASHAGLEPEKGISAVQIASEAIANMKLGRIDEETTANIGLIKGGQATNIVCESIDIKAEARSRNGEKLKNQTEHMKNCFERAVQKYGGEVVFSSQMLYPAFNISEDDEIIAILKEASAKTGIPLKLVSTGGGSDTNIINAKGIKAVDVSVGMDNVHSQKEQISIDDMMKAVEFLIAIITSVKNFC
jgi:tripeptide aminopeptidase